MASHDIQTLLFVECGTGMDTHGQDATKAAVRAVKDAIGFNSIPSARSVIPGGPEAMRVHVRLGVPEKYLADIDADLVLSTLPYGVKTLEVVPGGLVTRSGIALEAVGDRDGCDDMIMVCAAVEVGY
ncbi:hypothetical protein FVE85_4265 [Porphyridium purpureum]|uniref:Uncharacterized protein n=1 Tax=Porphyridium purpureum TaxID=35688 RepID=A0A5J4YTM8_PORPP|nr:hypothetical protein FVE85_4265 [Porphyridium purpureum]|eukprot:POR4801..scf229_5